MGRDVVSVERSGKMSGIQEHHWPLLFILVMLLLITGIMYVEWVNADHGNMNQILILQVCIDNFGTLEEPYNSNVLLCTQTVLLWEIRDMLAGEYNGEVSEYLRV